MIFYLRLLRISAVKTTAIMTTMDATAMYVVVASAVADDGAWLGEGVTSVGVGAIVGVGA